MHYYSFHPPLTMPYSSIEFRDQQCYYYYPPHDSMRECCVGEINNCSFDHPPYYPQHHNIKRQEVRFDFTEKEESMAQSPPPYYKKLTKDICIENWYQPSEILQHKKKARADTLDKRQEVDLCGLERYSCDRVLAKRRAVKVLLKAQKMSKEPEFLSNVSLKSSQESKYAARKQGQKIFHQVHEAPSAVYDHQYDCSGMFYNCKRKAWDCPPSSISQSDRRVRPRTVSPHSF